MEKCRSNGEVGGTFVRCLYACRYSYAAGSTKLGRLLNADTGKKFKQWSFVRTVSGWLVGARSDG